MSNKTKEITDLKNKVEQAYTNLKNTSVIKSTKNMREVIENFNERKNQFTNEEYLRVNGFEERVKPGKDLKRENKKYSDVIDQFLINLGIDEKLLLDENASRERRYKVYDFIIENLPLLHQALSIMSGAVLSPEMYSTDTIVFDESDGSDNSALIQSIIEELEIEKELPNWIKNSLLRGDEFVEIIDTETVESAIKSQILTESEEYQEYLSMFTESAELTRMGGPKALLEMVQVSKEIEDEEYKAFRFLRESEENQRPKTKRKKNKTEDLVDKLDSIFLKTHKPENIISIKVGNFVLGYLDINTESVGFTRDNQIKTGNMFDTGTIQYTTFSKGPSAGLYNKDSIGRITDSLTDVILKQMDKEKSNISTFLRNNKDFRDVIYNVVANKRKTRIRFIPPDRIIHWKNDCDEDDRYGSSIFAPMLLLIKHYLAVMTHHTIFNLTRGVEKRKIVVEVSSLDMDSGGALNNVIKSFKQKEQTLINQLNNLNSFGTELTAYDDVFIPKVNGELPIDVESIPGQENSLDPEYLEVLKSNILNGIRVPKSLLNEVENSYRTSLAQENIMFANQIVYLQKQYEPILNELAYRVLGIVTGDKNIERDITLAFNPPSTLLNESISSNIGHVHSIIDFISNLYGGGNESSFGMDENSRTNGVDKKELAKMFMKGIDWKSIDRLYYNKVDDDNISDITDRDDVTDDFSGGFGGMSGMDDGMGGRMTRNYVQRTSDDGPTISREVNTTTTTSTRGPSDE